MSDAANTPGPVQATPPAWKPILAALGNEAARAVFARAVLGELDAGTREGLNQRDVKAIESWRALGILIEDDQGALAVDGAALRSVLAAAEGEGSRRARAGVGKFLDGPRITAMPASPAERSELLRWVRDHTMAPDEVLTEAQLNQRLHVFHPDVAMLRRYLVDESLLERTPNGTEYAIPADTRIR
jgi:hypothetical protein